MKRSLQFLFALGVASCTIAAHAQAVAYVYVASNPQNSSTNEIAAYSAASDGKLSVVDGSPFRENVAAMAVNGTYLMAVNRSQPNIDSFSIGSTGALNYVTSTNYAQAAGTADCAYANSIFFDHSGADLYVQEYNADCANTGVASFAVNKDTGGLNYLGVDITGAFPGDSGPAYFIGNNVYAYTANNSACMYYEFYGFQRAGSGLLNSIATNANFPTPPPNVRIYVPDLVAADPTNHLAVLMQPANPPGCASGPLQVATYTASTSGTLHTSSKYLTMPTTLISSPSDMKMSPSGHILAVAGQQGLQLFHFNGGLPATYFTGLVTADPISEMFWDNANHLYAISQANNKLHVFTITPLLAYEAPGSPYSINSPQSIIVQPLSRP